MRSNKALVVLLAEIVVSAVSLILLLPSLVSDPNFGKLISAGVLGFLVLSLGISAMNVKNGTL